MMAKSERSGPARVEERNRRVVIDRPKSSSTSGMFKTSHRQDDNALELASMARREMCI